MEEPLTYVERVAQGQLAVQAFRAAQRARDRAKADEAYQTLMKWVQPILAKIATGMAGAAPANEALEDLLDQFHRDLFSPGYESMERFLGAYLRDLANQVRRRYPEKYIAEHASISIEGTKGSSNQGGDEEWEDPASRKTLDNLFSRIDIQGAIVQLPAVERAVLMRRLEGWSNNEIAVRLGVSPSTATRLYQTAKRTLLVLLGDDA